MYRFKSGDKVRHKEIDISGVITGRMTTDDESGEPESSESSDNPWYDIMWTSGPTPWKGFEADGSLEPIE